MILSFSNTSKGSGYISYKIVRNACSLEADFVHYVLQLQVLDVLNVNDKKFSVALSMYFGVHWKEDRLILPGDGHNNSGAEWVPIDLDFMQYLWVPNVFVYDIAEFHAIECLKRLAGIWVVKDKELFYNQVSSVVTRYYRQVWWNLHLLNMSNILPILT